MHYAGFPDVKFVLDLIEKDKEVKREWFIEQDYLPYDGTERR
jgi:hypothetical protein